MSQSHASESGRALKTAFKRLLAQLGGLEAAASCTRVARSRLAEYGNVAAPDRHAPIDVVLDLERIAQTPIVTEALARMHGYLLVPIELPGEGDIAQALQAVATDAGTTLSDALRALGGGMSQQELVVLHGDLSDLSQASARALALVNARVTGFRAGLNSRCPGGSEAASDSQEDE